MLGPADENMLYNIKISRLLGGGLVLAILFIAMVWFVGQRSMSVLSDLTIGPVSYTHLTLPTTPYV